ncbi:MAG: TrkA C-terminal domain-containing protein [Trichormus sp. ATA11-4-KO1]|jgi:NhaP-type Na+/H+ and K+/H+ antiporter|nr:TrkA C-terminal domain-containing protein [Trichormus sp. ATA11-4-KO1]
MASSLISANITSNSCYCGIPLNSLKLPEKCFVIGLIRDNQVILASTEPTIWYGDVILTVALSASLVPMLKLVIHKTHPVHYSSQECLINNSK